MIVASKCILPIPNTDGVERFPKRFPLTLGWCKVKFSIGFHLIFKCAIDEMFTVPFEMIRWPHEAADADFEGGGMMWFFHLMCVSTFAILCLYPSYPCYWLQSLDIYKCKKMVGEFLGEVMRANQHSSFYVSGLSSFGEVSGRKEGYGAVNNDAFCMET